MARYEHVSGSFFAVIALMQLTRAVLGLPAQVGTLTIPVWFSFVAGAFAAAMSVWGFRTAGRRA